MDTSITPIPLKFIMGGWSSMILLFQIFSWSLKFYFYVHIRGPGLGSKFAIK